MELGSRHSLFHTSPKVYKDILRKFFRKIFLSKNLLILKLKQIVALVRSQTYIMKKAHMRRSVIPIPETPTIVKYMVVSANAVQNNKN